MKQNKRYDGTIRCNENKIKSLRCIGMLFMLLMVKNTDSKSCSEDHVCLTWKIQNSSLVLICKVDTKNNFPITFYDPFHNATGFCVHVKCHSLLPHGVIKTRDKSNKIKTLQEIVFTIPIKVPINGLWTCSHGHNNSEAVAEVTIADILENTNNENRNKMECWCLMLLWSLFGFGCTWLLISLILIFVTYYQNKDKGKDHIDAMMKPNENLDTIKEQIDHLSINGKTGDEDAVDKADKNIKHLRDFIKGILSKDRPLVWVKVTVFLLSFILFALPLIVGLIEVEQCKAARAFSIYGAIVGMVIFLLLMHQRGDFLFNDRSAFFMRRNN